MHNEIVTNRLYWGAGQFFTYGHISLSNILTNRRSMGDAGRRGFVMRAPLAAQRDCVWLLLADQNTMKKEPLRETSDTSNHVSHQFPSEVFSENKHTGEWEYFLKESAETGPENKSRHKTNGASQTEPLKWCINRVKTGIQDKCSEIQGTSAKKVDDFKPHTCVCTVWHIQTTDTCCMGSYFFMQVSNLYAKQPLAIVRL